MAVTTEHMICRPQFFICILDCFAPPEKRSFFGALVYARNDGKSLSLLKNARMGIQAADKLHAIYLKNKNGVSGGLRTNLKECKASGIPSE